MAGEIFTDHARSGVRAGLGVWLLPGLDPDVHSIFNATSQNLMPDRIPPDLKKKRVLK